MQIIAAILSPLFFSIAMVAAANSMAMATHRALVFSFILDFLLYIS